MQILLPGQALLCLCHLCRLSSAVLRPYGLPGEASVLATQTPYPGVQVPSSEAADISYISDILQTASGPHYR